MHKKKRSTKQQNIIAQEVTEQQKRRQLLWQIKTLKRLPKDFRDIDPGSPDWEAFADITGRRKEMTKWERGPVVYFDELNTLERAILGSPNKLIHYDCQFVDKVCIDTWQHILNCANTTDKASWLYLPNEEGPFITALNVLLSRFGYTIRARGQVMSEMSGHAIGVIH